MNQKNQKERELLGCIDLNELPVEECHWLTSCSLFLFYNSFVKVTDIRVVNRPRIQPRFIISALPDQANILFLIFFSNYPYKK